ncbi:MAG TPA: hypothetical protein VKZ79_19655 [Alphaproteobacteria bacterium]|nr:hypothetical protein [Alphaproteobacteria bacterium]
MRPTISEQLDGLRRLLAEIIAPEIEAAYPREILTGVIAALGALREALPTVPAFLRWDADSTAAVLSVALPLLQQDLAAELRSALAEAPGDTLETLEARQERMRALLSKAMPAIGAERGDAYRAMVALFRERADRFPFAITATAPKHPAKEE